MKLYCITDKYTEECLKALSSEIDGCSSYYSFIKTCEGKIIVGKEYEVEIIDEWKASLFDENGDHILLPLDMFSNQKDKKRKYGWARLGASDFAFTKAISFSDSDTKLIDRCKTAIKEGRASEYEKICMNKINIIEEKKKHKPTWISNLFEFLFS